MIVRFISDPQYVQASKPRRIDVAGFVLLTLWLGTFQTVLDKGQDADWFSAAWICWFTVISVVSLVALLNHVKMADYEPLTISKFFALVYLQLYMEFEGFKLIFNFKVTQFLQIAAEH